MYKYRYRTDVEQFGRLCVCGHYRHNHTVKIISLLTLGRRADNCETCMCPRYRPDMTLDMENRIKHDRI